jgi:hypothetical protein
MFRVELDACDIPYAIAGPDGPLYADFHALRHSYVALLDQAGASLKQAMHLARHSDPKLTMARYGRPQLHDLGAAVAKLPSLLSGSTAPGRQAAAVAATGTDGRGFLVPSSVCTGFVQTDDIQGDRLRLVEAQQQAGGEKEESHNHLAGQVIAANQYQLIPPDSSSGGWDRTTDTRLMKRLCSLPCSCRSRFTLNNLAGASRHCKR